MPRFFCDNVPENASTITISGDDAKHIISSLRMAVGEKLTVCNSAGTDYNCTIEFFSDNLVYLRINEKSHTLSEPSVSVAVYFAMPKGDKTEFIIQKSVELGASKIVPFISERCVSRPDKKSSDKKLERYQKISEEAAKQCGRGIIPQVLPVMSFKEVIKDSLSSNIPIILYEAEDKFSLKQTLSDKNFSSVSFISGPEGGFSPEEIAYAKECGVLSVSLGKRILRCETAPVAALCAVMYHSGNLG